MRSNVCELAIPAPTSVTKLSVFDNMRSCSESDESAAATSVGAPPAESDASAVLEVLVLLLLAEAAAGCLPEREI